MNNIQMGCQSKGGTIWANLNSPVIVMGMHRSGTSLVCNVLERMGLFMGYEKDDNNEATFFLTINKELLKKMNSSWDCPPSREEISSKQTICVEHAAQSLRKKSEKAFWGPMHRSISGEKRKTEKIRWGWKDPRNTFTLPIWREIFPQCKVIHVCRNPFDVAESLRKRELSFLTWRANLKQKWLTISGSPRARSERSIDLQNQANGISLWKMYVQQCLEMGRRFKDDVMRIKYEDLLTSPIASISKMAEFLRLESVGEMELKAITSSFRKQRAYAFLSTKPYPPELQMLSRDPLVKELGYQKILLDSSDSADSSK